MSAHLETESSARQASGGIGDLSSSWSGRNAEFIGESVLDALLKSLRLDCALLRFDGTGSAVVRRSEALAKQAGADNVASELALLGALESSSPVDQVTIGGVALSLVHVPLGIVSSVGWLIAGARRETFPSESERHSLSIAATQAALAFRELRESESKRALALMLDTIPAMAWSTTPEGMADAFNKHALEYLGRTLEDMKGLGFLSQFHPDDVDRMMIEWQAMMASKRGGEIEGRARRADGEYRWLICRCHPLLNAEGEVVKWYGVNIDIEDRKRAENALKTSEVALSASERNLRLIIDSLPVLAFIARTDGSADFINQQYCDYVGLSAEELVDWGYVKVWHPEDVEPMMSRWMENLDADWAINRGRFRRHDGQYRECYLQARRITDAFGTVRWLGVALDIEDLQRAERALRVSEARLQQTERKLNLIINTIPAMAWSSTPDGMLDFCNQHLLDFVGLPAEQIMGSGFYRIFHPDDTPRMFSAWQEIMASKRGREVEARIRGADGAYRWFTLRQNPLLDADGEVVKWYGAVLDIEDRKRAEDALRVSEAALSASERNLRLTLDSLPVLAWSARPDGGADFVNQRWVDYAGVPEDQILEWGFLDFYHPDDVEGMVAIWARDLATADHTVLKGRIRRADGEYRTFVFAGRKITNANGVVRWIGANVDIEDLQRAEEQLRRSQTELAHMTRMTTMGELTVSIAHEVNQPLMAIVTNAGTCLRWLDEGQLDIEQARKAAERVVRDGHRAGDILASIRALARKAPPQMVPMDMKGAIEEVRELLKGEFQRRGVESQIEFPTTPVFVSGDRTQLQQVILNLVMNGVEAMAESAPENRRLVIQVLAGGDAFAQVRVADLGAGLDVGIADRVFDAFFSTKPGGIGMGLSICRSIVEAHGGRIWAAENEPRGSIFCFTVPLASGDEAP